MARALIDTNKVRLNDEQEAEQRSLRDRSGGIMDGGSGVIIPFKGLEKRALTATGQSSVAGDQGGMTIATEVPDIGQAMRANLVLAGLGARIYGGFRANQNLPVAKSATIATPGWVAENAANSAATHLIAQNALIPRRINVWMDVSVQLLEQQDAFNAYFQQELAAALAADIEKQVINGGGSGANQPTGILGTGGIGSVVGGTNGAAPTGANLNDLEYAVCGTGKADKGNVGFLISPWTRRKLRQISIIAAQGWPIFDSGDAYNLLGHPCGVTPNVPDNLTKGTSNGVCSAIICGEFSELFMLFWGQGIVVDLIKDATVYGTTGMLRCNATAYFNSAVRTPTAFAAMQDALCA